MNTYLYSLLAATLMWSSTLTLEAATKKDPPSSVCDPRPSYRSGIISTETTTYDWLCSERTVGCYVICRYECTYVTPENLVYTRIYRCNEGVWVYPSTVCLRIVGIQRCNAPINAVQLCESAAFLLRDLYCYSCVEALEGGFIFCEQQLWIQPTIIR